MVGEKWKHVRRQIKKKICKHKGGKVTEVEKMMHKKTM